MSIWTAIVPLSPAASLMSSASTHRARNPSAPTTNSVSGTKNRNNRNASALPTIVPGRLPIALVDPQADVDQRTVVVLVDELVDPRLLVGEPGAAALDQRPHPAPTQGSISDRRDLADVDVVGVVGRLDGRHIVNLVAVGHVAAAVSL